MSKQFKPSDDHYLEQLNSSKNQMQKKFAALVSVIIPTVNRKLLLDKAVESIANQTYKSIEVIIIDDKSDIPVSIDQYKIDHPSIAFKLIRNNKKLGGAKSRNIGAASASGDFLCFLDDDDIYIKNKIQILLEALDADPDAGAAFGKTRLYDGEKYIKPFKEPAVFNIKTNIIVMNMIHNNSTLIRRETLKNLSFLESLTRYQDLQFNIELSLKTKLIYVSEYVSEWRVDNRKDKTTFDYGSEKITKDLKSFMILYKYLKNDLMISDNELIIFKIKGFKMLLRAKLYAKAFKFIISDYTIFNIKNLSNAIRTRRQYWQ